MPGPPMSEWWTYELSDFLLFAPRTYYRLFELYNAELWPAQGLALALGVLAFAGAARGDGPGLRLAAALLGAGWLWVAWAFHLGRYADIHWLAPGFAAAFGVQGGLLLAWAAAGAAPPPAVPVLARRVGLGLLGLALAYPLLGPLVGRPWTQAELFGLAPDPTALGTLGLLLLPRRPRGRGVLWVIPLLWCGVSAATLWTMAAPEAGLLPAAALLALAVAWRSRRAA